MPGKAPGQSRTCPLFASAFSAAPASSCLPPCAAPQVLVLLDTQRSGYVDRALLLRCLLALG